MASLHRMQLRYFYVGISGVITLFFLFVSWADPPFAKNTLDLLEMKSLDFRFRIREALQPSQPGSNLAIIQIDKKSLEEIGRWPWSRKDMARLLERLWADGPRMVAFDILFIEPEVSESLKMVRSLKSDYATQVPGDNRFLETLRRWEREADADSVFSRALEKSGPVVLPIEMDVAVQGEQPEGDMLSPEVSDTLFKSSFGLVKQLSTAKVFIPIEAQKIDPPIAPLAQAVNALGHVYYQPDRDGVLRWEYLVVKYRDDYYPSFALQVARMVLGIRREEMKLWLGEAIEMGGIQIPTDERGRMLINYVGREGTYPAYSATDVLHGRLSPGTFQDKILLVGATAAGTYDIKVAPLSANMAGVEKNVTVIDNILREQFLRRTEAMRLLDIFFILLFGVSLWLILPRVSALRGAAVAASLLIGYMVLAQYLFNQKGLWINLLYPCATLVLSYTSLTVLRFMTEERQAQEVRRIFSSYVSPKVVAELVKNPEAARLGGQRKELTVLFSDIRGFTAFSERHQPEEVVAALNEYMDAMTQVIFYWDGTLDKFVGDAIMVFWGAPLEQSRHAELAVRCALHMQQRLAQIQESWRAKGKAVLDAGIGINTGEMVVGNMGAEGRKMDYTVIGDHVNLGARVESLTRKFNAGILISEFTYEKIKDRIQVDAPYPAEHRREARPIRHPDRRKKAMIGRAWFRDLDTVEVKGREAPVRIFEVAEIKRSVHEN